MITKIITGIKKTMRELEQGKFDEDTTSDAIKLIKQQSRLAEAYIKASAIIFRARNTGSSQDLTGLCKVLGAFDEGGIWIKKLHSGDYDKKETRKQIRGMRAQVREIKDEIKTLKKKLLD